MEIRRLRDLREDHDKSQKAIAEYLNMHRSVYRRYESGERETPAWVLDKLADCSASAQTTCWDGRSRPEPCPVK